MAKRAKSEWQVKAEAARKEAEALQRAFDAAAKNLGKDSADWLVYGSADGQGGTVHAEAIAADAELTHDRWFRFLEYLNRDAEMAMAKVKSLRDALDKGNPADALRWSDEAFRGAAEAETVAHVIAFLTERGPARLGEYVQERLVRAAAEAAPRSSSQPANLIEAYRAVAWSRIPERVRFLDRF